MAVAWDVSLPPFPYTLAFTSDAATGAIQQYVVKLSLSPGSYQLSLLPDLMVITTAVGGITPDDVNAFASEVLISSAYVTRTVDWWDTNGQLHSGENMIASLSETTDTIATATMTATGIVADVGSFGFYTNTITIEPETTISYANGSRDVYTSDYYLHVYGWNVSYPLGSEAVNTPLSGRFLITSGSPTGQRTQTWGDGWLNVQSIFSSYDAPDVIPPEVLQPAAVVSVPGAAVWTANSSGTVFVSPQFNYDGSTGQWSLVSPPAPGSYTGAQTYLIEGETRSSYLEALSQTFAWGAWLAQFAGLPSIVQSLYSGLGTATTLFNHEASYLKDLLGFLDRAPSAATLGTDPGLASEIDARLDKFRSDTDQIAKDSVTDSVTSQNVVSSAIFNFFQSLKLVKHQSTEFYTVLSGDEVFVGGSHKDTMLGSALDDVFSGGDNDDVALGSQGNDSLTGGAGNDVLDGGAGTDTASFSGNLSAYTITKAGNVYTVIARSGSDGTDSLTNVESLQFNDFNVNLTVQAKAAALATASVQRLEELYVAFFNRVPDADGLAYWIDQFSGGQTIAQIAESFYNAGVQYSSLTGYSSTMSNADFVNVVYRNVLGRSEGADAGGLAYWSGELASGRASHGTLVTDILNSAHTFKGDSSYGWVADLLDNKITVADTIAVDLGLNYKTSSASISQGMAIAAAVTATNTANALALVGITTGDISLF